MAKNSGLFLTVWGIGLYIISLGSYYFIFNDIYLWGALVLLLVSIVVFWWVMLALAAFSEESAWTGVFLAGAFGSLWWLMERSSDKMPALFLLLAIGSIYSFFLGKWDI